MEIGHGGSWRNHHLSFAAGGLDMMVSPGQMLSTAAAVLIGGATGFVVLPKPTPPPPVEIVSIEYDYAADLIIYTRNVNLPERCGAIGLAVLLTSQQNGRWRAARRTGLRITGQKNLTFRHSRQTSSLLKAAGRLWCRALPMNGWGR